MPKSVRSILNYAASAIVMLSLLALFRPSEGFVGAFYAFSFWTLVGLEAFISVSRNIVISDRWSGVDRLIGYIFTAPLIWPVRMYELMQLASRPSTTDTTTR